MVLDIKPEATMPLPQNSKRRARHECVEGLRNYVVLLKDSELRDS